jgi:hypothetical protein
LEEVDGGLRRVERLDEDSCVRRIIDGLPW